MEGKLKEEILKLSEGFDNELFNLYIDKIDENSSYYILLASLIFNQNDADMQLRKKQLKLALALFEEGLLKTTQNIKNCDKYDKITSQNNIRIASEYLLAAYLEEEYLPTFLCDIKNRFTDIIPNNNKKALALINSYFAYDALLDILYIIFNYQGVFKKRDLNKTKEGIMALVDKSVTTLEYSDTLSIIAGELITKKEDYKYINTLCDFVIRVGGSEKAFYFKAYVKKDSDEFNTYIEKYIDACKEKNIDILDPFEIIK